MADWTVISTSLGAAGITGTVGYRTARWQGRVSLDQARMELEHLRAQHREDHLRNRQATYHEFLDEASWWGRIRAETHAIFSEEEPDEEVEAQLREAQARFRHLLNGVRLFGTSDVRAAADALDLLTPRSPRSGGHASARRGSVANRRALQGASSRRIESSTCGPPSIA